MAYTLNVTLPDRSEQDIPLNTGEMLFVLGANGTGKSSLMQRFNAANNNEMTVRISAHRQTWFQSQVNDLSPYSKQVTTIHMRNSDAQSQSRWKDDYSSQRAGVTIYDLINSENLRNQAITAAVDADNSDLIAELKKKDAPLKIINEILKLSNMPVVISIGENSQVFAQKNGGSLYSIAELSDGERNALLIASSVLTAKTGSLLLIDEPERHLHRSIVSPLLTQLFAKRSDCVFVISTHEIMLTLDNPSSKLLLVRSCTFLDSNTQTWDTDLLTNANQIDENLKKDVLGSRRNILFVEGNDQSLDKPFYSILFPNVSVIPKSSCREVQQAVSGIRDSDSFHWLRVWGIVDSDGKSGLEELKQKGIYALSVYSIESIYYHPEIIKRVAKKVSEITEADAEALIQEAKSAALECISSADRRRLSAKIAEKAIRETILSRLPRQEDIQLGTPVNIQIDVIKELNDEIQHCEQLFSDNNWEAILMRYPVRETQALDRIAKKINFQNRHHYEGAVRRLLQNDTSAISFVQSLFGTLSQDISATT